MAEDTWFRNYSEIQDRIDKLYNTEWFQSNVCFPTIFFYTDKDISDTDFSIEKFLTMHLPKGQSFTTKDTGRFIATGDKPNIVRFNKEGESIKSYMEYEQKLKGQGKPASDAVLRQFVKVSNLKNFNIPLAKKNNALTRSDSRSESSTITLEFLNDKNWKVLWYLQSWQDRWYSNTYQKKSLTAKAHNRDNKNREGGEGYLGLANCSIDVDGNITVDSHLSLFGLIPKAIRTPQEFGPGTSSSGLSKISVDCLYSHIILTYPRGSMLSYYYYA